MYTTIIIVVVTCFSLSFSQACNVFLGMTCTCYETIDIRCTMSKMMPITLISPVNRRNFQSIDLKFQIEENIQLNTDYFLPLNSLLSNASEHTLSMTLRFQNFYSFQAKTGAFRNLLQGIRTSYSRLTIELHPLRAKSILFEQNSFDNLHVNELSIYADSLTSSFQSIFNNTNITHLNIEGAIVSDDPSLHSRFTGQIRSLKMTRMIDTVNSDEFPSFPVQSYTIEAHKMRSFDAQSFVNYSQLTGLNLIQPDVSITSKVLHGLENLSNLRSISIDAERIADGALKHAQHIQTLILGSHLKMLDSESLHSLTSLQQLDIRYIQFSTLQANTSCALADFINRKRMLGLTVYLPAENTDCDCVLVFLNNMIDNGEQINQCQSTTNDRCLFSSCSIVSEYFTRKQRENQPVEVQTPAIITPSIVPPSIDLNEQDSPFYPDVKEEPTTVKVYFEPNIYDDLEEITDEEEEEQSSSSTTTTTTAQSTAVEIVPNTTTTMTTTTLPEIFREELESDFSTPIIKRLNTELKTYGSANYLIVSWIPFAIIASCLFLSLVIAMISYIIYHKHRTVSFKLIPQSPPII